MDILPVLKDSIAKIERVYKLIGYRLNIPTGELAGQNMPQHFYMRVVPKYGVGSTGIREHYKAATPEQEKEIKKRSLQMKITLLLNEARYLLNYVMINILVT